MILKELWNTLKLEFGHKSASDFCSRVFDTIELISQCPFAGSKYNEKRRIRSLLITQNTRLLYRVKTDTVIILKLLDTRRHSV